MHDPIVQERLELIIEHTLTIIQRINKAEEAGYLISSDEGKILYDSLLIRLQAIGENIKKIERINPGFVQERLGIETPKIIRFRDILSHHYELLDYQVVFNICTIHIPELYSAVKNFLEAGN